MAKSNSTKKPKIAVVTGQASIKSLEDVTLPNKRDYCRENGYELFSYNEEYNWDLSRGYGWMKVPLCIELLQNKKNSDIDWFFWIDTDACFMNFKRKLEEFIDDWAFFIVGRDCNGINVGTHFFRNNKMSLDFFKDVWRRGPQPIKPTLVYKGVDAEKKNIFDVNQLPATEQGQYDYVSMQDKYRQHFSVVPNKKFNAYIQGCVPGWMQSDRYEPGDIVIHLGGNWAQSKEEIFKTIILPNVNTNAVFSVDD